MAKRSRTPKVESSEYQRVLEDMLSRMRPPGPGRALIGAALLAEVESMEAEGVLVPHDGVLMFRLDAAGHTSFSECGIPWANVTDRLNAHGWHPARLLINISLDLPDPPPQREGVD